MVRNLKRLLIVDDSLIDREVLKNILCNHFDIMEADNGYSGLELILKNKDKLSAILLDVSMPVLDGFNVLRIMRENRIDNIPVFLITSEATKTNIERAKQFNISEFIKKPFESEEILKRLSVKLDMHIDSSQKKVLDCELRENDIPEINEYILKLESIYKNYFVNNEKEHAHYKRMADLMKILLRKFVTVAQGIELDNDEIDIISKGAYFCNIGYMAVPKEVIAAEKRNEAEENIYQNHTVMGASMIQLNTSKSCKYFVNICADMCMHHHERYDGNGFPDKLSGDNISVYAQMCRLVDEFDSLFFSYKEHNERQFNFVVNILSQDKKTVSQEVFGLLTACKNDLIVYYTQ